MCSTQRKDSHLMFHGTKGAFTSAFSTPEELLYQRNGQQNLKNFIYFIDGDTSDYCFDSQSPIKYYSPATHMAKPSAYTNVDNISKACALTRKLIYFIDGDTSAFDKEPPAMLEFDETKFYPDDIVHHPNHGEGRVSMNRGGDKYTVLYKLDRYNAQYYRTHHANRLTLIRRGGPGSVATRPRPKGNPGNPKPEPRERVIMYYNEFDKRLGMYLGTEESVREQAESYLKHREKHRDQGYGTVIYFYAVIVEV